MYQGWQFAKENGGFGFQFLSHYKYLNFKIGKFLLEWQIQQISTNDKHLHEDIDIFNSLRTSNFKHVDFFYILHTFFT